MVNAKPNETLKSSDTETVTPPEEYQPQTETERPSWDREDESPQAAVARLSSGETDNSREGYIVHKQYYTDNEGVRQEKVHGPMPVTEWPAYAAEHGF